MSRRLALAIVLAPALAHAQEPMPDPVAGTDELHAEVNQNAPADIGDGMMRLPNQELPPLLLKPIDSRQLFQVIG